MNLGNSVSVLYCIPFLGMLLSIALFPLLRPGWWGKNRKYVVIIWSLLFLVPFAMKYGLAIMSEKLLDAVVGDYFTFIILLFGLFCVTGNISIEGDLTGSPKVNVIMILIGTMLSSWIGTTGASMVMIRPLIRANRWRSRKIHVIVFFIFLVSNIGGCLTPVGDPPLLMGFMRKVPFFWSIHLLPVMLINVGILLGLFFLLDYRIYRKDFIKGIMPEVKAQKTPLHIKGLHNIIFLAVIVAAVILSGILPDTKAFSGGIHIFGDVELGYAALIEAALILLAAFLSCKTTDRKVRESNHFSWDAIQEVAVLFIGIFITMIPALMILNVKGAELGLTEPWQMFWVTGAISSFLDNTPTYLAFLTAAGNSGAANGLALSVGNVSPIMLTAISCGAVFMGANTYIGNAPNFMVKSIAEENGISMPSFFGYMFWSVCFLLPVFLLDTLIFLL